MPKVKYLVLFTLFAINLVEQPAPEVEVEQGILSGKISNDGTFFEYLGIPYATANSTNRFQAPFPAPKWNGVFKATDGTVSCPQDFLFSTVSGVEDCLRLNVYVPIKPSKPLPVMFYVHGGAFTMGSGGKSLIGPEFLVKQDIILVTINYRLGALGFLCLGIKEAPGNAGLKDQLAALKWVKKNIGVFGGDPDNLTIFGESAGGTSVSLLVASEATKGLFNRAIVQSGSSLANWAINRFPVQTAIIYAKELGLESTDPLEIYNYLSQIPIKTLVASKVKRNNTVFFDPILAHLPCIEEPIPGVEPFLDDLPYKLLQKNLQNISLMFGSNSNEGLFLIAEENKDTLERKNNIYLFATDLQFKSKSLADTEAKKVKQFYFGDEKINLQNILKMSDVYNDFYFEIPSILETEHIIANSNISTYNYYFDYSGYRNFLKIMTGYSKEKGACHADELLYLFDGKFWPFWITKEDKQMINWMTRLWSNFAKYGNPTPDHDETLPTKWIPSDKNEIRFLRISNELEMGSIPDPPAYNLWKEIYTKYRKYDIKTPSLLSHD